VSGGAERKGRGEQGNFGKNEFLKFILMTLGLVMAKITLQDIPEDLHAQLEREAAANFRSLS